MQDLKTLLKENGLKATRNRLALLAYLSKTQKPHTASEILTVLKREEIDQATVYRILDVFLKKALIKQIEFKKGSAYYELASQGHHHHLICKSCDRVEDVILPEEFSIQEKNIEKKTNFKIQDHSLEFFGLCAECK